MLIILALWCGGVGMILQNLNATLAKIPSISERLVKEINKKDWSDVKKKLATDLVEQLNTSKVKVIKCQVNLEVLRISISPCEAGIMEAESTIMVQQLEEFVVNLVEDLNQISQVVKFDYVTNSATIFQAYEKPCTFLICWEI